MTGYNASMKTDPTRTDPYSALPELYDLEHSDFVDDIDFYVNHVMSVGDPVLELGCGTGRVLLPIAEAGYRVTGLDFSATMLAGAEAAKAVHPEGKLITLVQGDMIDADNAPGGPFGVVIISLNGLLHLWTSSEQRSAIASARKALDPRGQLLIDILNPTPAFLGAFDQSVVHEGSWQAGNGDLVEKFSSRRHHAADQLIETHLWYDVTNAEGAIRRITTNFTMRYITRAEIELMLELEGFSEWQVYGSYDLDPFADNSERILIAAEATSL